MTRDAGCTPDGNDQRITAIRGRAIPVRGGDIDTDRIIPARFLRCVTFEGLGEHAFADDRQAANGSHPFDQKRFQGATVLVVGENFGCGSSREHAPQSLRRWGIHGIVGESFAEIFFGNCVALGIPCLTLDKPEVAVLQSTIEADPETIVTLNVLEKKIEAGQVTYRAGLPDGVRESFISGAWEAAELLMTAPEEITAVAAKLPYMNGFS